MPSYGFRCPHCKALFTLRLPMKESGDPQTCPECDYPAERQLSAPLVRVYGGTPTHYPRS